MRLRRMRSRCTLCSCKANIAGAISCTRTGAQDAIPTREEVDSFGKAPVQEEESPGPEEATMTGDE